MVPNIPSCHYMLLMWPSRRKFISKPISCFVYVLNNHCHRVTTQLQLINIIIPRDTKRGQNSGVFNVQNATGLHTTHSVPSHKQLRSVNKLPWREKLNYRFCIFVGCSLFDTLCHKYTPLIQEGPGVWRKLHNE
jgi:hypothetical protein